jgi:hypothetical protein
VRSFSGLSAAARLAAGGEKMRSNCGVVVEVKDLGPEAGLRRDEEEGWRPGNQALLTDEKIEIEKCCRKEDDRVNIAGEKPIVTNVKHCYCRRQQ